LFFTKRKTQQYFEMGFKECDHEKDLIEERYVLEFSLLVFESGDKCFVIAPNSLDR
jgi:hypothetical protein